MYTEENKLLKRKVVNGPVDKDNRKMKKLKGNKVCTLYVDVHKNIGLNRDKEFLDFFKDAKDIFVESKFFVKYENANIKKKLETIGKMQFHGEPVEVRRKQKVAGVSSSDKTSNQICVPSLVVDVPKTATVSDVKRLFPDSVFVVKRKRKGIKYFLVKYSSVEDVEKDSRRAHSLTINGEKISVKLRIPNASVSSAPASTASPEKELKEKLQTKFKNKLETKKNKKKIKKLKAKSEANMNEEQTISL